MLLDCQKSIPNGLPLKLGHCSNRQTVCCLSQARHWLNAGLLRCYIALISLTSHKTWIFISAAVRNWNLANSAFFSFYIWFFAYSFLPFPLLSTLFVFPIFPPSSPHYKCHICAYKSLIPLLVSVSQLTPRYWLLLWRQEHLICGCPSLMAMIMAPLCAWVDWACWMIHRTLMQPCILFYVQQYGVGVEGSNMVSITNDRRSLCSKSHISTQDHSEAGRIK